MFLGAGRIMGITDLRFPQAKYETVLTSVVEYFSTYPDVYAVVLTGSLARGKAVKGSCIDLFVFRSRKQLRLLASTLASRVKAYRSLGGKVCYHQGEVEGGIEFGDVRVDVGFTDGSFNCARENSFDITRDAFETTVGNLLVYSVPLYEKGKRFQRLKKEYLPFYGDALREARLKGTLEEFNYKIWKTKWLAGREEYLAALYSLLEAQQIFVQHVFTKQRKYPIDYVKWLEEQCSQILSMPLLYQELRQTLDKIELTEKSILQKSRLLEQLFVRYGSDSGPFSEDFGASSKT